MANAMKPFFPSPSEFRAWLEQYHGESEELWVGFYKRSSGKPSITWPEAVDTALCFGWIDGVRKSIDEVSYTIRFTPRRPRSIWSDVNIKRVSDLIKLRLMRPAGLEAFGRREQAKSRIYSYEQRKTASWDAPMNSSFEPMKLPGVSFRPRRPGIEEQPRGGS